MYYSNICCGQSRITVDTKVSRGLFSGDRVRWSPLFQIERPIFLATPISLRSPEVGRLVSIPAFTSTNGVTDSFYGRKADIENCIYISSRSDSESPCLAALRWPVLFFPFGAGDVFCTFHFPSTQLLKPDSRVTVFSHRCNTPETTAQKTCQSCAHRLMYSRLHSIVLSGLPTLPRNASRSSDTI